MCDFNQLGVKIPATYGRQISSKESLPLSFALINWMARPQKVEGPIYGLGVLILKEGFKRMTEEQHQNATILVVDDMTDNLILLSLALQNNGYHVLTAQSGEEAIRVASIAKPDLILMDIAMPDIDGLAATRRIRKKPELLHVPVIALTAFETQGFRQAAYEAGFDGYLTKPIDFVKLNNLINVFLRDMETTDLSLETKELTEELVLRKAG